MSAQRQAFEAWWNEERESWGPTYLSDAEDATWRSWQAALSQQAPVSAEAGELPLLSKPLLDLIGEYGLARTDGVGEFQRIYLWERLLAGIKDYARDVLAQSRAQAVPASVASEDASLRDEIGAIFDIGSAARSNSVILVNASNCRRRSDCLSALEREVFVVPAQDPEDGREEFECPLPWGAEPATYLAAVREHFKIKQVAQAVPAEPVGTFLIQRSGNSATLETRWLKWIEPLPRLPIGEYSLYLAAPAVSEPAVPPGYVLAPHYRGYARLGLGEYVINHTQANGPAELVISVASDQDKAGRAVGDDRENPADAMIQPEDMAVRIRFENVAGLDALEKQLFFVRAVHFPDAEAAANRSAEIVPTHEVLCEMAYSLNLVPRGEMVALQFLAPLHDQFMAAVSAAKLYPAAAPIAPIELTPPAAPNLMVDLEALRDHWRLNAWPTASRVVDDAIRALRAAPAEPSPEQIQAAQALPEMSDEWIDAMSIAILKLIGQPPRWIKSVSAIVRAAMGGKSTPPAEQGAGS